MNMEELHIFLGGVGDFCFGLHIIVLLIIETKCYLHLY